MSVINNAFNGDDTFLQRLLRRAAHWMLYGIAADLILSVAAYLGAPIFVVRVGGLLACGLIMVGVMHNALTRLCVQCMAAVPEDASAQAARRKPILWITHIFDSRLRFLAVAVVIFGLDFAVGHGAAPKIVRLPVGLFMAVYMYSVWLHHKLRPWCPYCQEWGDGGMREPSPDPTKSATV